MRKAVILSGEVINLIEYTDNSPVGLRLPKNHFVYDCGQYPVQVGDTFENGVFSRAGEPISPIPSPEQRITALEEENLSLTEGAVDLDYRVLMLELGLN